MTQGRMPWHEVDTALRRGVETLLGAAVVEAVSQPGGFSPGSADRVRLADRRRAFVKTGSDAVDPDIVGIHRAEGVVAGMLPAAMPAPALLGVVDLDDRIALVFDDVEARHPRIPWRLDELRAAFDALAEIATVAVSAGSGLSELADQAQQFGAGWSLLDRLPVLPGGLGAWVATRRDELVARGLRAPHAVAGDRLVHGDARADNILIRPDGSVVLIDWPWGGRGAGWFDALTLLYNVRLHDPSADVDALIATSAVFDQMPRDDADTVLAALAGHFLFVSQQPHVPAIPRLRTFQFDQAVTILTWLRERID